MLRYVVCSAAILAAASGQVEDKLAKILKEQRFNAGDGRTGAAFATENGQIFREESDGSGNRVGQYSYIGDDGQTYTVKYSAGKDGFRILEGSHIPSGGQDAAAFNADFAVEDDLAPEPQIAPQQAPRFAPAPQPQQPIAPVAVDYADYDDAPVDPNFNPFINPHDPTHRNFQFNSNAAQFAPDSPEARSASLVPPCADCAGVNPFINPFDSSHQQAGLLAGHLAGVPQQPRAAPRPAPQPRPIAPQPTPLRAALPVDPTPRPTFNSFPPGQLNLNRFETGFNFDFSS